MTSEKAANSESHSASLGQAATQFLLGLPSEEKLKSQQEVYKFVRWYGEGRQLNGLSAPEIGSYTEQITSSTTEVADKLRVIKAFLTYSYKQGLTKKNMAVHLKSKNTSAKFISSTKQVAQEAILLTAQGYADLEAELAALKEKRPQIIEEIQKAAADKDVRENAPLEAAREHQGQVEARIKELESTLKMAETMAQKQVDNYKVDIGDIVVLRDLASGEQLDYTLVDAAEANPTINKISVASPMGQALLRQKKGNKVEVKAPASILHYQIEDIKHG